MYGQEDGRSTRWKRRQAVAVLDGSWVASACYACKWCAFLQIFHERIDVAEVFSEQILLVVLRSDIPLRPAAIVAARSATSPVERTGELARATLRIRHWCLWHEVEIQELQELDFDVLRGLLILEQARYCEQAVHVFEGSCVLWCREKGGDEDKERLRLDCWAVVWVEEVEEEVHVDFTAEDDARWWVQEEESLEVRERGEDEDVVLAVYRKC